MMAITLTLPYPPTANNYVRHTSRGHYMAPKGKMFMQEVLVRVYQARLRGLADYHDGRLHVTITLRPHNNVRHDIDNRCKPLLDALQQAKCFRNDEQIDQLVVLRDWEPKTGDCVVTIRRL